jgi:hypothetical protein
MFIIPIVPPIPELGIDIIPIVPPWVEDEIKKLP